MTCAECHHPYSFHGNGRSNCKAMGCKCAGWVDPKPEEESHSTAPLKAVRGAEPARSCALWTWRASSRHGLPGEAIRLSRRVS